MLLNDLFSTAELKAIFTEEIAAAGGTVSDAYDDGSRLFVRSILPRTTEVRRGDQLQGGVALRAGERLVCVYPYTFRLVCRNGAIVAHAIQTKRVECGEFASVEDVANEVREAVRACCEPEAFAAAADEMRSAVEQQADTALNLLPMLAHLPSQIGSQFLNQIVERFFRDGDPTRFGFMNAVTSVARDTADPELRWRLEELGGGIPVGRAPTLRPDGARAVAPRTMRAAVGSGV